MCPIGNITNAAELCRDDASSSKAIFENDGVVVDLPKLVSSRGSGLSGKLSTELIIPSGFSGLITVVSKSVAN